MTDRAVDLVWLGGYRKLYPLQADVPAFVRHLGQSRLRLALACVDEAGTRLRPRPIYPPTLDVQATRAYQRAYYQRRRALGMRS